MWYQYDKIHRDHDRPAQIYSNGSQTWYQHDLIHRNHDRPASIHSDGSQIWFQYGKKHRDRDRVKQKEYKLRNKERLAEKEKIRKQTDPLYKLRKSMSSMISICLKKWGGKKGTKSITIIGIGYEGLRKHFESQFEPWMSWDNYGKYKIGTFNYGWDIDHIIPTSTAKTEEELLKLAAQHAEKDHGIHVSSIPPAIMAMVKAAIKDE